MVLGPEPPVQNGPNGGGVQIYIWKCSHDPILRELILILICMGEEGEEKEEGRRKRGRRRG